MPSTFVLLHPTDQPAPSAGPRPGEVRRSAATWLKATQVIPPRSEVRWPRRRQRVQSLERFGGVTLVEVRPRTGYLHRIRATLAHPGHPIAGDLTYGGGKDGEVSAAPQLLHAASLRGEGIELEAVDPEDFEEALASLRRPPSVGW